MGKKHYNIEEDEKEILEDFEKGEFVSVLTNTDDFIKAQQLGFEGYPAFQDGGYFGLVKGSLVIIEYRMNFL